MSVPAWMPGTFTQSLTGTEDFITDGDLLLKVIDLAWKSTEHDYFKLDDWQRWLVRHVLERYPDDHAKYPGQLRYRQVIISMGRQNGKSVLGAIFALYGLLLDGKGPEVVSVASTVKQANIIYKRVKHVIDNNPTLQKRFKTTGTRGIVSRDAAKPASYEVQAGKEESLQGVTISKCLFDEVHICKPESWNAVVFGTSARPNGMVLGITTAGDEKSELLKLLYKTGHASAAQEPESDERFGFFLWEAPEHLAITDPQFLIAANPAIACGRMDLEQEINAIRNMPPNQARRYRGNQFVASEASWLPPQLWSGAEKGHIPKGVPIVFTVERAENWAYATITANAKVRNKVYTEVVASLVNPTLERLEDVCYDLHRRFKPMKFLMKVSTLRELAYSLRDKGVPVEYLTTGQEQNACAMAYALLAEGNVIHADDPVVNRQMPRAVAKNSGEGWRISARESVSEVDAVIATVIGIFGASTTKPNAPALFVG